MQDASSHASPQASSHASSPAEPTPTPPAAATFAASPASTAPSPAHHAPRGSVKETLIAIIISLTMAFVFRGFVVEGFLIPTGSMAPTLLGQHVRVKNPASGVEWTVGPWDYIGARGAGTPMPRQGGQRVQTERGPLTTTPLELNDPITGQPLPPITNQPTIAGDRVFVLKYIKGLYDPERWDVIVFKPGHVPLENYIKRLVGLPNEQLALVDGDVFTRPIPKGEEPRPGRTSPAAKGGIPAWQDTTWTIQRKPERVQRAVWRRIFDSTYTPTADSQRDLAPSARFRAPWIAAQGDWQGLADASEYASTAAPGTPATITWDTDRRPIDDYNPYNQTRDLAQRWSRIPRPEHADALIFPVSDIAAALSVRPEQPGLTVTAQLTARGFIFEAAIEPDPAGVWSAILRRRPTPDGTEPADTNTAATQAWQTIAAAPLARFPRGLPVGEDTRVEFWHADQALWLFVNGTLVAGGTDAGAYSLTPAERVRAATGRTLEDLLAANDKLVASAFADTRLYRRPALAWSFASAAPAPVPFALRHITLARDLYYQVTTRPTLGTHPNFFPTIGPDEFLMCGDNSPASEDGRMWDSVDPWVADQVNPVTSLVNRKLLIGRAFVVYLPAPYAGQPTPMFDFGRMRWIW